MINAGFFYGKKCPVPEHVDRTPDLKPYDASVSICSI